MTTDDGWKEVVEAFENIDGDRAGGRLKHRPCGKVILSANLNRESLELMYTHHFECVEGRGAPNGTEA